MTQNEGNSVACRPGSLLTMVIFLPAAAITVAVSFILIIGMRWYWGVRGRMPEAGGVSDRHVAALSPRCRHPPRWAKPGRRANPACAP